MDINIACGSREIKGKECVNMDIRKTELTDVIHDVHEFPWPFKDEEFGDAYALDIVEHICPLKIVRFIDEIWRIVKPGGKLYIRTNYFQKEQAYRDPTHCHYFTLDSFDFWDPSTPTGTKYPYSDLKWKIISRQFDGDEILIHMEKMT